jgi:type I restriction enzyme S subunit
MALKRALRPGGVSTGLIKGESSTEPGAGLVPGYSASGQDVWLPEATHFGPGLVLSAVGARCGKVFQADGAWSVVANTVVLTPQPGHDARFLWYLTNDENFWEKGGTAQPYVRVPDTLARKVWLPALEEQRAIADYLDTETARIDALIEKKQRLIELLREQFESRLTAIFDMRGVPTPALSVVVRIAEGQVDPRVEPFASMMLIAPDHVESGTGRLLQATSAAEQGAISGKYLCEAGDVIYSKIRPALRKVCIATDQCLTSADMYPMRPSPELVPRYLSYFLLSDRFSSYAVLESERVAMPKINRDAFGRIRIPIPTRLEQLRVVDELDAAQFHLRSVSDRVSRQSESLREYRQALITAAVTGELKVPGVAA